MKLRNITTAMILSIVSVYILIIALQQNFLILPKFEAINVQKAYDYIEEGIRVIDDQRHNMSIIVNDYAV